MPVNRAAPAILSVCVLLLTMLPMTSCKSSGSAVKAPAANLPPITGKRWRLEKEMIAADNKEDYAAGAVALGQLDAFGTMEVSKLFYHHNLVMVPAGTMVGETGPRENGAIRIRVLDGPQADQNLWLYPKTAEKLGFPAPTPTP
jgi:hypothetical protein